VKAKDVECDANDMCDVGLACSDKCVPMFSIEFGNNSKSPAACKTLFVAANGTCANGPKLHREGADGEGPIQPIPCKKEECKYQVDPKDEFFYSSCVCGMDYLRTAYCNPGLGDIKIDDVYLYNF
jgi:hypothetical protein